MKSVFLHPVKLSSLLPLRVTVVFVALFLGGCGWNNPQATEILSSVIAAESVTLSPLAQVVETQKTIPAIQTPHGVTEATHTPVVRQETSTETLIPEPLTPDRTFTATLKPTLTLTPTDGPTPRFTRTFTPTPTATNTPTAPDAALRISRPGLYSMLVSPYKMEAMVTKGEDGFVYLSLIGEDQRVISEQSLDYRRNIYSRFLIAPAIEFAIPAVAETARLFLETRDLLGRVTALSSVDIILLSIGDNRINPAQQLYEPFIIDNPANGAEVQGGRLVVSGWLAPLNATPIIIEILGEAGEVISSRQLQLQMHESGPTHAPFIVELPYIVLNQTRARLSIRQESDNRLPGTITLSSVAVTLYP